MDGGGHKYWELTSAAVATCMKFKLYFKKFLTVSLNMDLFTYCTLVNNSSADLDFIALNNAVISE